MLIVIPVVVLLLASLGGFVYGAVVFVQSLRDVVRHPIPVGNKIGLFLLVVDLFLVGATLLIAAVGLYELFISRIESGSARRMPEWLEMHDLNDLKARVIAMIVLVASVSFAQAVVDFDSGREILELGGGIGIVVGALGLGGAAGDCRERLAQPCQCFPLLPCCRAAVLPPAPPSVTAVNVRESPAD